MALNTLPAGAFADDAISSDKINLANTFAFTGTVTGTSDLVKVSTTTVTSAVSSVDFETLSTDFNHFCVHIAEPIPSTNNEGLVMQFKLNGSYQTGTDGYKTSRQRIYQSGSSSWTDSANGFSQTYGGMHLGQHSAGNTYVDAGAHMIIWFHNVHSSLSHSHMSVSWGSTDSRYSSASQQSAIYTGTSDENPLQGIRFKYGSGNIAEGRFSIYGLKT